ncbi:2-keto-3-deoxy-L-rhamnonate aldolase [Linum grandiflorum]
MSSSSTFTAIMRSDITTRITTAASPGNPIKARLREGNTLYGIFLMTFSPTIAEIAALAGYDFVVIDMEHGHGGISEALPCLHALAATNTPAILRLPENSPTWAKKALDLGPQGLMFPLVHDPESAKRAVSYCRYPPAGTRGAAHPVIRASKYGLDADYVTNSDRDLFVMCQVESVEAVNRIGVITAVDGVDCVMVGPLDLSADMGYLNDPGQQKVKEMISEAEEAVLGRIRSKGFGAYLAGFAMGKDGLGPEELKSRGYHMIY